MDRSTAVAAGGEESKRFGDRPVSPHLLYDFVDLRADRSFDQSSFRGFKKEILQFVNVGFELGTAGHQFTPPLCYHAHDGRLLDQPRIAPITRKDFSGNWRNSRLLQSYGTSAIGGIVVNFVNAGSKRRPSVTMGLTHQT